MALLFQIARLPRRGHSFVFGGVRRQQPPLARLRQQLPRRCENCLSHRYLPFFGGRRAKSSTGRKVALTSYRRSCTEHSQFQCYKLHRRRGQQRRMTPVVYRITRRLDFWLASFTVVLSWMVQMASFRQKPAAVSDTTPDLYAQFRELIRLRDQVRKAQASVREPRRKSRRKERAFRRVAN
jgi:hypothetical protein